MTQEDKELLLQDLCGRLPYGVKVNTTNPAVKIGVISGISIENKISVGTKYADIVFDCIEVKPYLRPMSSMTEEEEINLYKVTGFYYLSNNELRKDEWYSFKNSIKKNKLFFPYPIWLDDLQKVFDWLNKNQFDYRDLIPKGLAIAVTKENNPYEN